MRKSNEQSLGEALKLFVNTYKHKDALLRHHIHQTWNDMMGPGIASKTQKVGFIRGKLVLSIDSAPLRHELHMNRDKIAARLNEKLGEGVVKEVLIR